jgi:hypothetical protein
MDKLVYFSSHSIRQLYSSRFYFVLPTRFSPMTFQLSNTSHKKKEEKKNHIKQTLIVISRAYLKKDNKTKKDIYLDHVTLISYPIIICSVLVATYPRLQVIFPKSVGVNRKQSLSITKRPKIYSSKFGFSMYH